MDTSSVAADMPFSDSFAVIDTWRITNIHVVDGKSNKDVNDTVHCQLNVKVGLHFIKQNWKLKALRSTLQGRALSDSKVACEAWISDAKQWLNEHKELVKTVKARVNAIEAVTSRVDKHGIGVTNSALQRQLSSQPPIDINASRPLTPTPAALLRAQSILHMDNNKLPVDADTQTSLHDVKIPLLYSITKLSYEDLFDSAERTAENIANATAIPILAVYATFALSCLLLLLIDTSRYAIIHVIDQLSTTLPLLIIACELANIGNYLKHMLIHYQRQSALSLSQQQQNTKQVNGVTTPT
jgi:hypothetical protein